MRVLHGPVNVGNQPWVLSRHERALGVESDLVVNYNTWLQYGADRCLSALSVKTPASVLKRLWFGLTAPLRYDVLHYYFGLSFLCWNDFGARTALWFRDLQLARTLGRKVFMTLQGCDVRLSAESARRNRYTPCHEGRCSAVATCRATLDRERRFLIDDVLPHVHRTFVLNPELAHFVPGATFMPYASVDVEAIEPRYPRPAERIVILHAPSDASIKGTAFIVEAVEKLKARFPIEFVLVTGLKHEEAMRLYARADLVIDQVMAGWYGGFAVETMAMGKPVLCYIREEDLCHVPRAMAQEIPVLNAAPHSIESVLSEVLSRPEQLYELGQRSRAYVLRWHNPRTIAEAMIRAYRDPASSFELAPAPGAISPALTNVAG